MDQIVRAAWVVLRVLVRPLTTERDLGTCCYLLDRHMGPCCPLVWALKDLIITIDKNFSSFLGQMATNHRCKALAFDISCVINTYLNACAKSSAMASPLDLGGRTPALFQFIIDELEHGHYLVQPLLTFLRKLFLARDNKRAAAARSSRQPPPPGSGVRSDGALAGRGGVYTPVSWPHTGVHRKEHR